MKTKRKQNRFAEEWARKILEQEFCLPVIVHDDGSENNMYDLRIGDVESLEIAIECTASVNSKFVRTWNEGPANGPLKLPVNGNWYVEISEDCHVKTLYRHIENIIKDLEAKDVRWVDTDFSLEIRSPEMFLLFNNIGISHISRRTYLGDGTTHIGMRGDGGPVDTNGTALSSWCNSFVSDPKRADNIEKLKKSNAKRRHLFIIVSFMGAPWNVFSYLSNNIVNVPMDQPTLLDSIDEIWVVYSGASKGVRWNGNFWQIFSTLIHDSKSTYEESSKSSGSAW